MYVWSSRYSRHPALVQRDRRRVDHDAHDGHVSRSATYARSGMAARRQVAGKTGREGRDDASGKVGARTAIIDME